MVNSNEITLLNVKLNSTEKKITNVENASCLISVSYCIKDDEIMLFFHVTCREGSNTVFEMECEYKCIVEDCDYDDEKDMVMNLIPCVSSKVEELVATFTSQLSVDA